MIRILLLLIVLTPINSSGLCRPSGVIAISKGVTPEQAKRITYVFTGRTLSSPCERCFDNNGDVGIEVRISEVFFGNLSPGKSIKLRLYWADISKFDETQDSLFIAQTSGSENVVDVCAISGHLDDPRVAVEYEWIRANPDMTHQRLSNK